MSDYKLHPALIALADNEDRVNRDMARQLAIPLAIPLGDPAIDAVEELCRNHDCYICGELPHHFCSRCERPICEDCDGSGITATKCIDYDCCTRCADYNPHEYD